jgi:hypothetical protein
MNVLMNLSRPRLRALLDHFSVMKNLRRMPGFRRLSARADFGISPFIIALQRLIDPTGPGAAHVIEDKISLSSA